MKGSNHLLVVLPVVRLLVVTCATRQARSG
jgi:hypothetical protein